MKTASKIQTQTITLHRNHLVVDGNSHRPDLCQLPLPSSECGLICEAMLPQIRTVATLIAAERHAFTGHSPEVFTEEADFFAARILVLGVRRFHLNITLLPMLKTANRRAQAFAAKHGLPFAEAEMRMSLHANRPHNLLIIETEHAAESGRGLIADTLAFAAQLQPLAI